MLCPCGCKRVLHLNLLPDERPCWTLTLHPDGTSTLFPSGARGAAALTYFGFGAVVCSGASDLAGCAAPDTVHRPAPAPVTWTTRRPCASPFRGFFALSRSCLVVG